MLTKKQEERIYECPCIEEGVKCTEKFRYSFNLRAHILKEHKYTLEGKELLAERNKRRRGYEQRRNQNGK